MCLGLRALGVQRDCLCLHCHSQQATSINSASFWMTGHRRKREQSSYVTLQAKQ